MPLLVALWIYLLFFHGLGRRDLWNSHEARAALNARSVLQGEWLVPELGQDRPELQKPPLYYWLVAGLASLQGGTVDAAIVRLPSALAACGCLAALLWLGRLSGRFQASLLAALLLATALHFTWLARVGRIDMPLTLTTTAALACFYLGERSGSVGRLAGGYVALAAALLLKGPIGVVLVAAVLGTFFLWERTWPRLGLGWGIPLLLALALPWFVLANDATDGELFRVFFWHHNVERGLGGSRLRGHPLWFYPGQFILDFAPWSLLLPPCLIHFLRRGQWREDRLARFGLVWFASMTLVLSLARYKRADYLVPAYPGAALFLGCVLSRSMGTIPSTLRRRLPVLVMLAAALGWWLRVEVFLPRVEPHREQHSFARRILEHASPDEPIVFFHLEGHLLASHLERPVQIVLHWDQLEQLRESTLIVMPEIQARQWRVHLRQAALEEVTRTIPDHEKPMVLFRLRALRPTTVSGSRGLPPCLSCPLRRQSRENRLAWSYLRTTPVPTSKLCCANGTGPFRPERLPSRSFSLMRAARTVPSPRCGT